MKDQKIIKAIAELDGWNHWFNGWNKLDDNTPPLTLSQNLPPYLTSRDAIVPVIEKQDEQVQEEIAMCCRESFGDPFTDRCMMLITPRQLCEELLRATGKRKE